MEKFAKLFEHDKYGQILVMLTEDDDGDACVKFMAQPPGLGICHVAISFADESTAREVFDNCTQEQAAAGVAEMWNYSPVTR